MWLITQPQPHPHPHPPNGYSGQIICCGNTQFSGCREISGIAEVESFLAKSRSEILGLTARE